ncbi:S-adenosyl-L-methionine-dependent methyltransferase [Schizophyllum fasciatum]
MDFDQQETNYLLPYDEEEVQRLNVQHEVLLRAFRGQLVIAPVDLGRGKQVLDSGTGTGIWTLRAVARYPDTTFIGIDIQPRNFPQTTSANARFLAHNLLTLPEDWSNKFDFVHQRLLLAALRKEDWRRCISEIHRVLQPGGWTQLVEYSTLWLEGPVGVRFRELHSALFNSRGLLLACAEALPQILSDFGFRDIMIERAHIDLAGCSPEAVVARRTIFGVFRALRDAVVQDGGFGIAHTGEEYVGLVNALEEEVIHGTYPMEYVAICAHK